jgi:hypothetical protein
MRWSNYWTNFINTRSNCCCTRNYHIIAPPSVFCVLQDSWPVAAAILRLTGLVGTTLTTTLSSKVPPPPSLRVINNSS